MKVIMPESRPDIPEYGTVKVTGADGTSFIRSNRKYDGRERPSTDQNNTRQMKLSDLTPEQQATFLELIELRRVDPPIDYRARRQSNYYEELREQMIYEALADPLGPRGLTFLKAEYPRVYNEIRIGLKTLLNR